MAALRRNFAPKARENTLGNSLDINPRLRGSACNYFLI
jgi:hypothetical protein